MKTLPRMIVTLLLCAELFMSLYPSVFADAKGNVKLPDDTTIIGEEAFMNCTGMTSISIPVSVTQIESRAFYGCSGLKDVYYSGTTDEWDDVAIEAGNGPLTIATIHCTQDYDWTFEREIEIVCPWGLGGGADSTVRPMATLLQNELGVPVEVRNETGGSGVTGTTYAYNQLADGYTFLLGTQTLFIQDLMDNMDFNFKDEFECEDILVHSFNILAGSKKQMDKYGIETFSELQEYVSSHPNEVSIARLVAIGIDHMCFTAVTKDQALNMKSYQGGYEVIADMVGGNVDLAVGGYDDLSDLIKSGDVIPLLVFCEHRIDTMPDCECTAELSIDCYAGPWRAIFAKKGTPQGAIDALIAAIEKCREDTTWKEFTRNAAYDQRAVPAPGEELQEFYLNEYKNLRDYMIDIQVLEKDYDDLA